MKNTKRALRRHHAQRMQQRAYQKIITTSHFGIDYTDQELWLKARYQRDHLCDCSCPMCGNPRHSVLYDGFDRLTMQEHRASDIASGMQEYFSGDSDK